MTLSPLANGYILGWSVAWPPGPINAEMIRRGLLPKDRGGGFWSAWPIGLGACTGDFIWAFGVCVGAGAPAQLGRDPVRTSDRKSRTALISSGSFRHWGVENLSRPSQCRVSSAKKRTARRFLIWSFCGVDESVERWLLAELAGRDRSHRRCGYVMVCHSASAPFSMNPTTEPRTATLTINEIYHSIQGESTWAGLPCVFVRLTFCDLRCTYCDTAYAFYEGEKKTLSEITTEVLKFDCPLVEITGGEPLLQKNVLPLMSALADAGKTVLLETSGAHDIAKVDRRVHRIMDLKTPGSGECERNLWSNIKHLTTRDEVKFVIGSREDYEWSREKMREHNLSERCHAVLFSPIFGRIEPRQIVEWMLADNLAARFQLQMHKFIWSPTTRGV